MQVLRLSCFAVLFLSWNSSQGQSGPTPSIPVPSASGTIGRTDPVAAKELAENVGTAGASPWTAMQATGSISYWTDDRSYPAKLTILGSSRHRLDAETEAGSLSIRINSGVGKIQTPDGKVSILASETASSGIFQFAKLRMEDLKESTAIIDGGNVKIDGMMLHRLTVENPIAANANTELESDGVVATDLYFAPNTHLLVKSVNSIKSSGVGSSLLRIITYEDYRPVDGSMIPFRYTQILDGQKLWTLQLSQVQLNPSVQTTFFEF